MVKRPGCEADNLPITQVKNGGALPPVFHKFPCFVHYYLSTGTHLLLAPQPAVGLGFLGNVHFKFFLDIGTRQKWVALRPGPLVLGDRALSTHRVGDKVGSSDGLDAVQNRRKPAPSGNRLANVFTITDHYTDSSTLSHLTDLFLCYAPKWSCEHGNAPFCFVKGEYCLEVTSDWCLPDTSSSSRSLHIKLCT